VHSVCAVCFLHLKEVVKLLTIGLGIERMSGLLDWELRALAAVPLSGELIQGFAVEGFSVWMVDVPVYIARAAISIYFVSGFWKVMWKKAPVDEVTQKPGTT
jgi:hypothetical protein